MTKIAILYKTLGFFIFLAILSLAYCIDLHQQYSNYLDAHLSSRKLKQNVITLNQDFKQKDAYTAQFTQTQTLFNSQMSVFPSTNTFSAALDTVKTAAENAHLHIQRMTPSTPVQKDFYYEIPVQMTLIGTYQQILDFMQMTSTWSGPLFIWKNWTLSHQSKPKTTVLNESQNNDLLQMDVNAVFFYTP
ncbi:MAG TPA: type 4a pilus biogenesis protein PilO [Gammaproteobacteria bacterium]|nr:type 4a pilus biogenesis protein PilO [Gammaproteobacteria bacterium]